jgi:hypothetical protein
VSVPDVMHIIAIGLFPAEALQYDSSVTI